MTPESLAVGLIAYRLVVPSFGSWQDIADSVALVIILRKIIVMLLQVLSSLQMLRK